MSTVTCTALDLGVVVENACTAQQVVDESVEAAVEDAVDEVIGDAIDGIVGDLVDEAIVEDVGTAVDNEARGKHSDAVSIAVGRAA